VLTSSRVSLSINKGVRLTVNDDVHSNVLYTGAPTKNPPVKTSDKNVNINTPLVLSIPEEINEVISV
jgi:hypothetical protein